MSELSVLQLASEHLTYFNYTFCINRYSFLKQIVIDEVQQDVESIQLKIFSELGLFEPYIIRFDKIHAGKTVIVNSFDFSYNLLFLKALTEKDLDAIHIQLLDQEERIIAEEHWELNILPMDFFGGLSAFPQLLVSYMMPNHPAIYNLKTKATEILQSNGLKVAFEGYQSNSHERVLQMVSAVYKAIQDEGLIYSVMPPSFESEGQRIRLLDQVLATKFGNCIDISILFSSILEAINLHPILIITKGHAFIGVWLEDQRLDKMVNFDQTAISKRIAKGTKTIALIETTTLCKGSSISFSKAMEIAEVQLLQEDNFLLSLDVKNIRAHGLTPLPLLSNTDQPTENVVEEGDKTDFDLDSDYHAGENYHDLELSDLSNLTKTKLWERKLLDLSLRNNLLNLKFTKSMLQLVDIQIAKLEDRLTEGKSYSIQPDLSSAKVNRYNVYEPPLHPSLPLFKLSDEEFDYQRLMTYYHADDLNTILTHLSRSAKLSEEENGKSTLYLGVGMLKWYDPKNTSTARLAPILLIPVELSRRSVNSKFTLRSREEETMINITLLEYLRQEFQLNLNSLETLPTDDSGVDVSRVFALMRNAILNLDGWDVLEQFVLGIFSFNKLILWQDISKFTDEIQKSSIVKSLIDGKLSQQLESVNGDFSELEELSAASLTLPIPTDNSQLNAVRNANSRKTFILHGPPGTGKSQTITNIIADALANNRKVLFVAAKKAALEVVQNRLEKIGIGPFCLELHSNKSKKSDVLRQFEDALSVPKYQLKSDYVEEAERIDNRRKILSKYVEELHKRIPIGWSLYDTLSFLEEHSVKYTPEYSLDLPVSDISLPEWNEWNDWVEAFAAITKKIGNPNEHPLRFVQVIRHQLGDREKIQTAIDNYLYAMEQSDEYCTKYDINVSFISSYINVFEILINHRIVPGLLDFFYNEKLRVLLEHWLQIQSRKSNLESDILSSYNRSVFKLETSYLSQQWNQSKSMWFLSKWIKQRKIKSILQGYAKNKITSPNIIDQLFVLLEDLDHTSQQLKDPIFIPLDALSTQYATIDSINFQAIREGLNTIERIDEQLRRISMVNPLEWIQTHIVNQNYDSDIGQINISLTKLELAIKGLEPYIPEIPTVKKLRTVKDNLNSLEHWVNYRHYVESAKGLRLNWFIDMINSGLVDVMSLDSEFVKIFRINHFVQSINRSEELNSFDADVYTGQINQYKKLHKEFTQLSQQQLIMKLSSRIPNFSQEAVQSSEVGILQKAIRSRGRGISIRNLFDQIPTLITRLKPCMLMSPISVAQYFDVNEEHFDVVIFDEASQLPTSEAISALARAKQAIIVGDPKQMPPTNFFTSQKVDDDNYEIEDLESILEDCLALSIPSNHLLRHYRSKHESLISFSNKNFYDGKLLTFPSPDDRNRKVTYQHVPGFYDKGRSRTNRNEAKAIIDFIANHLRSGNIKSLGVVTFSQTQQNLIEDLLLDLFQLQPQLEIFANQIEEQIFIKNLENVQGDERDIILFSVGYGPDDEGKVSMNFGPLNRDGGWRRLNVAVTRARYEMKVFASLRADQIDLNRTKSEGVKGLKEFLNFAEKGAFLESKSNIFKDENSLIDQVSNHLVQAGFSVAKNIGSSDYKIDIGIVNPENEEEYILGILMDGHNYFRLQTTHDRELLAPSVLQMLGWNVFRIWSLDWFKNKERIIQEIQNEVKRHLDEKKLVLETPPKIPAESMADTGTETKLNNLVPVEDDVLQDKMKPYNMAILKQIPFANSESIYFPENRLKVQRQMLDIINIETPISQSLLFRKVKELWNTYRAGNKLQNYLIEQLNALHFIQKTESHDVFYWSESVNPNQLDYYRDNSLAKREIIEVSAEEIRVVTENLLRANISMERVDLIRLTARTFGFQKVGGQINTVISSVINSMNNEERIVIIDGRIALKE